MAKLKNYYLFVIQAGSNPLDIYVGQSHEEPEAVLMRYSSSPALIPKKLRKQPDLMLRKDLYELYPTFPTQDKALFYENLLAEKLQKQGYNILSKSLKKKRRGNITSRSRGSSQNPKNIRRIDYRNEGAEKDSKGDLFAYGRKKSHEWNDETALKFQQSLSEKIKQRLKDNQ